VALTLFEVNQTDAKTFSFIMFVVITMPLLVGGAVATGLSGLKLGDLRARATRRVAEAQHEPAEEAR
jgi:hypothetical protein